MKKFILMTLVTATALWPMAVYASEVVPTSVRASAEIDAASDFQRDERRAERQAARAEGRSDEDLAERRQAVPVQAAPVQVTRQESRQAAPVQNARGDRQQVEVRTDRRDASQQGRYYDRNRDGNLDRRWDRNDDERIDRRLDRNRNGQIDRRYDRNNDDRVDRWSNNWRNDSRYDWRGHRQRYSNYYRPGRYYSPYRGHNYNRISIGFSLGSGYYGSRYWINDPWQYRLPAAYGSYRWVRYYDDVSLVDLRSGRVVDVIRHFF